jgi:hypothetical protein
VETRTPQLSNVVTSTEVRQLPTITRNPYDLVQTSGFVSSITQNLGSPSAQNVSEGFDRGVGMNINGQRSASVNILLDGGENVDQFDATTGQTVPLRSSTATTSDFLWAVPSSVTRRFSSPAGKPGWYAAARARTSLCLRRS